MIPTQKASFEEVRIGIGSGNLGVFTVGGGTSSSMTTLKSDSDKCMLDKMLGCNSAEHADVALGDKVRDYKASHHLFMAYFAGYPPEDLGPNCIVNKEDWAISCIKRALMLNKKNGENKTIDICLPISESQFDKIIAKIYEVPSILSSEEKATLKDISFSHRGATGLTVEEGKVEHRGGATSVRLINGFRFNPASMLTMVSNADFYTGQTGDQSLYEGLLSGKLVVYQALRWKQQQFDNLVKLCSSLGFTELSDFYRLQIRAVDSDDKRSWSELVKLSVDKEEELKKQATQLAVNIKEEHDLNGVLEKVVVSKLLGERMDTARTEALRGEDDLGLEIVARRPSFMGTSHGGGGDSRLVIPEVDMASRRLGPSRYI